MFDKLNDRQKEAVMHIDGPCLVIAGAGSGKTKVLTTRIAHLIESGIPDYNILAITFTNKAAKEMRERLNLLVPNNRVFVGTFHSFGLKIIRENLEHLGMNKNFTILDSDDVLSLIKKIMKEHNIDPKEVSPYYVRSKISFIKNELLVESELDKYFNTYVDQKVVEVYKEYDNVLRRNNSVDFDDLLALPVKLFRNNKDVLDKYQEHYKYILIDEYQDTNEVQYKMSKLIGSKYQNIFVVGDANQSIYSFRGANFRNILNFEKDYKEANVIALEQNYRSTKNILDAANSVIKNNKERKDMELFSELGEGVKVKYLRSYDEKHEITLIADEIKRLMQAGYKYSDIAIFYRTNAQSRNVEEVMLKNNFPYKVFGSFYFYNRKEIKDLLCYLRLINNINDDISLRRIINVPKRKIGNKSVEDLEKYAERLNTSMFDAIDSGKELDFKNLIRELQNDALNMSLTELVDDVLDKSGMKHELEVEKTLDSELRLENLMEFKSITASFEARTGSVNLGDFLDEISLVADISEHEENDDVITLMTLHSAKGLEFPIVFITGMEEGIFPHSNAFMEGEEGIEEERRLCYVGFTRAREKLYLTNAKKRMLYGKTTQNPPSRFISEVEDSLLEVSNMSIKEEKTFNKSEVYSDGVDVDFNKGDVVLHTMYGKGVIVDMDDRFLSVAFARNFGVKKIAKNFKGIKKM
ncbi:MAG: UvrD-helicase domain-containing protein [Bacilli bacterium]|jgi:DNA helicase-2/ATP-dependent DNA helicase PcrA|nr:UvrD-helicase domain-containing protein [Bacilli bacterium]